MRRLLHNYNFLTLMFLMAIFGPIYLSGFSMLPNYHSGFTTPPTNYIQPHSPVNSLGGAFNPWISADPTGTFLEQTYNIYAKKCIIDSFTLPFLIPYQGLGTWFFETHVSGFINPLYYLKLITPYKYWDVIYFICLFLIGIFVRKYLVLIGLDENASFAASMVMVFCGWVIIYMSVESVIRPIPWFFSTLYVIERWFRQPKWRWRVPCLVFSVYCLLTAGHPAATFFAGMFLVIYSVGNLLSIKIGLKNITVFMLASLAAVLMASPNWLSFMGYLEVNSLNQSLNPNNQGIYTGFYFANMAGLFNFVLPYCFGYINQGTIFGTPLANNYWSMGWLLPTATFMAFCGLFGLPKNNKLQYIIIVAVGLTAFLFRLDLLLPASFMSGIPVLGRLNYFYVGYLIAFTFVALAGNGVYRICKTRMIPNYIIYSWYVFLFLLLASIAGYLHKVGLDSELLSIFKGPINEKYYMLYLGIIWLAIVPIPFIANKSKNNRKDLLYFFIIIGLILQAVSYFPNFLSYSNILINIVAIAIYIVFLVICLIYPVRERSFRFAPYAIAFLLMLCTLWLFPGLGVRYNIITKPPYVDELKTLCSDKNRVYSTSLKMFPAINACVGISSLNTVDSLYYPFVHDFYKKYLNQDLNPARFFAHDGNGAIINYLKNKRYYDLLGCKYLITSDVIDFNSYVYLESKSHSAVPVPFVHKYSFDVEGVHDEYKIIQLLLSTFARPKKGQVSLIALKKQDVIKYNHKPKHIENKILEENRCVTLKSWQKPGMPSLVDILFSTHKRKNSGNVYVYGASKYALSPRNTGSKKCLNISHKDALSFDIGSKKTMAKFVSLSFYVKKKKMFKNDSLVLQIMNNKKRIVREVRYQSDSLFAGQWNHLSFKELLTVPANEKYMLNLFVSGEKASKLIIAIPEANDRNGYIYLQRVLSQVNCDAASIKDNELKTFILPAAKLKVRGEHSIVLQFKPKNRESILSIWKDARGEYLVKTASVLARSQIDAAKIKDNSFVKFVLSKKILPDTPLTILVSFQPNVTNDAIAVWRVPSSGKTIYRLQKTKKVANPVELVYKNNNSTVCIYRSPTAFDRVFFVSKYILTKSRKRSFSHIDKLVLDKPVAAVERDSFNRQIKNWSSESNFELKTFNIEANNIKIKGTASGPGIVVLTDQYRPGWKATLNGKPHKVIPVSGLFMGILVDKGGDYDIEMTYRPIRWNMSIMLALAGIGILLVLTKITIGPLKKRKYGSSD